MKENELKKERAVLNGTIQCLSFVGSRLIFPIAFQKPLNLKKKIV